MITGVIDSGNTEYQSSGRFHNEESRHYQRQLPIDPAGSAFPVQNLPQPPRVSIQDTVKSYTSSNIRQRFYSPQTRSVEPVFVPIQHRQPPTCQVTVPQPPRMGARRIIEMPLPQKQDITGNVADFAVTVSE